MYSPQEETALPQDFHISDDVVAHISERDCDFRISTSCGGPMLLPISLKRPKPTDIVVKAGNRTIFISVHQARYLHKIHMGLIPRFYDNIRGR
jgi:hypothetical protein